MSQDIQLRVLELVREAESRGNAEEVYKSLENWLKWQESASTSSSPEGFLDRARRLDQHGQTDAALDLIFDQIDEMLLGDESDRVDAILSEIAPDTFSVDLLVGLLTVTLPAKKLLFNRSAFFTKVEQSLRERGKLDDRLLVGLD